MTRRSGFSIAELAVVVLLVGMLAGIAVPVYTRVTLRARAASVLAELQAVRTAAFAYNTETGRWPPDRYPGETPPELAPYLPDGFSFDRDGYLLDWENWRLADGTPRHPATGVLLGISLTTDNAHLGRALEELLGPTTARFTLGNNYTFVIAST